MSPASRASRSGKCPGPNGATCGPGHRHGRLRCGGAPEGRQLIYDGPPCRAALHALAFHRGLQRDGFQHVRLEGRVGRAIVFQRQAPQRQPLLGRGANVLHLLFSPVVRFIKFYVMRLGFLDGLPGLLHISIGCMNSYVKYMKLIELRQSENK